MKLFKRIFSTIILIYSLFFITACKNKQTEQRIVIWTSCSEFAQYIELFNKTYKTDNAILVYKENPSLSLPPAKDELPPDIIVGPWLRNEQTSRYFKNLDYFFDRQSLSSEMFYSNLLQAGKFNHSQFLLPVSFNLPAVIFSTSNRDLIPDNYTMSLEQLRTTASNYNRKKGNNYTKMGFTPFANPDFLYLTTKLNSVNFREEKGHITYNQEQLDSTLEYLKDWTFSENGSAQTESDFAFKYLFMPYYRQVSSGRTLYAYTTSNQLFKILQNQDLQIDYRWICSENSIPAEDSLTMLGIYKHANNQVGATEFINWFFKSESQRAILERKEALNLETELFGIAGGFSANRHVTEHILPIFYTPLLSNLPPSQMITVPQKLPSRWESYNNMVIEQYLLDYIKAESEKDKPEFPYLEREWRRKIFD